MEKVKYNRNGIKTEGFGSCSLLSQDYLEAIIEDQFEEVDQEEKESKMLVVEALRKILPAIIGRDNYIKYYLFEIEKIPSASIAEFYGVCDSAIRKSVMKSRQKIDKISEIILGSDDIENELYDTILSVRDLDFNRRKGKETE